MALTQALPDEVSHPGTARRAARGATAAPPARSARVPAPDARRRPRHAAPEPAGHRELPALTGLLVVGAHGGAGTTTLAALLRAEMTAGREGPPVPVRDLRSVPDGDPDRMARSGRLLPGRVAGPLVVAARGNAEGARRAVVAVTALGYLGIRPAAVALVGDGAGPLPRAAAQRLDLLGDRGGPVVEVPFAASLRAAASPGQAQLPGRLLRAVTELAGLALSQGREGRR
jgi:hypothetical protein